MFLTIHAVGPSPTCAKLCVPRLYKKLSLRPTRIQSVRNRASTSVSTLLLRETERTEQRWEGSHAVPNKV